MNKINIKNFYLKNRLWIFISLLASMFLLNCFFKEVTYIAFSILILLVVFDNTEKSISYLIFSLPFSFIYQFTSIVMFITSVFIEFIKFFIIYIFKDKGKINLLSIILCLIFFIYCILPIGKYNYNLLLKFAFFVFIFAFLICCTIKPEIFKVGFNIKILVYSILLSCVFGLFNLVSPFLQSIDGKLIFGNGLIRYGALMHHPNVFAMLCEITLSILAYEIITGQHKWHYLFLFCLTCFVGIFTFSKTYLIIVFVVLLSLLIWLFIKNWKKALLVLFLLTFLGVIVYFAVPNFISTYVSRFVGSISNCNSFADFMNMITTGRYDLWFKTCVYLGQNLLCLFFGNGLGANAIASYSTHNAYLSMIYQLGIVGSILLILAIGYLIKTLFKKVKVSKAIIIPILVILLLFLVEDTIFYVFF